MTSKQEHSDGPPHPVYGIVILVAATSLTGVALAIAFEFVFGVLFV